MAGFVGSRVRVPFYTPRLPTGGGGGGVFQPRGAGLTTYKPNRSAEVIGGLGMLFSNYQVGLQRQKQQAQERVMSMLKMGQLDPTVLQSPEFQKARTVSGYPAMTMPKAVTWDQLSTPRSGYSLPTVTTGPQGRIKGVTYRPKETYPEGKERTAAVVLEEISKLIKIKDVLEPDSFNQQILQRQIDGLGDELLELQGLKVKETLSPATESPWPFGWGDKPQGAGPSTFELVPKSLTPTPAISPTQLPPTPTKAPTPSLLGPSEPTAGDLESYRRMGLKEYTSPSGKKHPLIKPVTPGLDAIAAARFGQAKEPQKATQPKQTFDKYPEPKTEKEFNNTISRIPSKKMKILYFKAMIEKIKDEELAKRIYEIWVDELYE